LRPTLPSAHQPQFEGYSWLWTSTSLEEKDNVEGSPVKVEHANALYAMDLELVAASCGSPKVGVGWR
jgi:hypothetical protein